MDREQRAAYGPVIREARKAKGLDQETLSEMTGISRRTIGSIERGDTVAQHEPLTKLLAALDLSPVMADEDVQAFIVMVTPLLQQVSKARRERLMQDIVGVVLTEIRYGDRLSKMPIRKPVSDQPPSVPDAIAAHEDGSIAGEQESTHET